MSTRKLIIVAGGPLFRVDNCWFEKSWVFATMYFLPTNDEDTEGTIDQNPVILEDIKAEDF